MQPQTKEIAKILPYAARDQLVSYLEFVRERAIDVALELNAYPLDREKLMRIEVSFLVRFLWEHYGRGFANFMDIFRLLERNRVSGFQIGGGVYTRDSPLARDWQELARTLERLVSSLGLEDIVFSSQRIDSVLRSILSAKQ